MWLQVGEFIEASNSSPFPQTPSLSSQSQVEKGGQTWLRDMGLPGGKHPVSPERPDPLIEPTTDTAQR